MLINNIIIISDNYNLENNNIVGLTKTIDNLKVDQLNIINKNLEDLRKR